MTTYVKVVGPANNKVVIMENHCNMQTLQLLLDRSLGNQGRSSTNVDQATKSVEWILVNMHSFISN